MGLILELWKCVYFPNFKVPPVPREKFVTYKYKIVYGVILKNSRPMLIA